MKLTWFVSLVLVFSFHFQSLAGGFVAIPQYTKSSKLNYLKQISQCSGVKSVRFLFSPSERSYLKGSKKFKLSQALVVELKKRNLSGTRFLKCAKQQKLPFLFESFSQAPVMASFSQDPLEQRQWGLSNRGESQPYAINELEDYWLKGTTGEGVLGNGGKYISQLAPTRVIKVAVLDTGVDVTHPDLKNQILRKPSECKAKAEFLECVDEVKEKFTNKRDPKRDEAIKVCESKFFQPSLDGRPTLGDTDGNGYPMDCEGYSVIGKESKERPVMGDFDIEDLKGHGTFVAGVIAAERNGFGTVGVASAVKIIPVKVIDKNPLSPARPASFGEVPSSSEAVNQFPKNSFSELLARGVLYAIRSGADIINMSFHWPPEADSALMRDMIELAQSKGILVVSAAGNDSSYYKVLPCHYTGVICVGAHGPDGKRVHFSNYGHAVDLLAPGLRILSTWPLSGVRQVYFNEYAGFEYKNGTSFSAPMVVGMLAHLMSHGVSALQAKTAVLASARTDQREEGNVVYGNADLSRAYAYLNPETRKELSLKTLITSEVKDPIEVNWDGSVPYEVPVEFSLSNISNMHYTGVNVSVNQKLNFGNAELKDLKWEIGEWSAESSKKFKTILKINDLLVSSYFYLELKVESQEMQERLIKIPFVITLSVDKDVRSQFTKSYKIKSELGNFNSRQISASDLKLIVSKDTKNDQIEYLVYKNGLSIGEKKVALLSFQKENEIYSLSSFISIKTPDKASILLRVERVDIDLDGNSEYVLIFEAPAEKQGDPKPKIFEFYHSDLSPYFLRAEDTELQARNAIYFENSKVTSMPENYQWVVWKDAGELKLKLPTFVRYGLVPDLEKKRKTAWPDLNREESPSFRLYYLSTEGLRSAVKPEDDYFYVQMLSQSTQQEIDGKITVLLGKQLGEDSRLEYKTATLFEGELSELSDSFKLNKERILTETRSIRAEKTVDLNFSQSPTSTMTSMIGAEGNIGYRSTILYHNSAEESFRVQDMLYTEENPLDQVKYVPTVFFNLATGFKSAFALNLFDVKYFDFSNEENIQTAYETQGKYSFISELRSIKAFLPVVFEGQDESLKPALLMVGSAGAFGVSEIIIPQYSEAGALEGLIRPALFKMDETKECKLIKDLVPFDAVTRTPSQRIFLCGDSILQVPLKISKK